MAVLAIVIPVIVVLAAIVIFAASRRRDTDIAEGYLSRETIKRDRAVEPLAAQATAETDVEMSDSTDLVLTGREVEKAAALARSERGESS